MESPCVQGLLFNHVTTGIQRRALPWLMLREYLLTEQMHLSSIALSWLLPELNLKMMPSLGVLPCFTTRKPGLRVMQLVKGRGGAMSSHRTDIVV